jgi:hypothetical protein
VKHSGKALAVVYTLVLTLLAAVTVVNPDLQIDPSVFVGILFAFAIGGGFAVARLVYQLWVLWLPGVVVILCIPITVITVIAKHPKPDGQGGAAVFIVAIAAIAGIGCGLGMPKRHFSSKDKSAR